jgi:hypothetical protein
MSYLGKIYKIFFSKPSKKSTSAESMRDASPEQPPIPSKPVHKRNPRTLRRRHYGTRARATTMTKYRESLTGPPNTHTMTTRKQTDKIKQLKKTTASKRVAAFMQKRKIPEARANYLNMICSNSGICIAFGKKTNMIKKHFNGFVDFSYLTNMKRIGAESKNGFIHEFEYKRKGYVAHAILKSAMEIGSDNLFYEYLVGQYVNKLNLLYPCFLETYGWYKYNSEKEWEEFQDIKEFQDIEKFHTGYMTRYITQQSDRITKESFEISCSASKLLCILIQHINEAISMHSILKNLEFMNRDLLYVLYQIYMPLAMNVDTFTHYDLHAGNVLLYEPVKGKYIEYHYHLNNETISFKCCYLAKIIDYGRCFFVDNTNPEKMTKTSKSIYNEICKLAECNYTHTTSSSDSNNATACGEEYGYSVVGPESPPGSFYHTSSSTSNMSHDLRLLYIIQQYFITYNDDFNSIIDKVQYGFETIHEKYPEHDDTKGTMEQTTSGLPDTINNVIDAHTELKSLIINDTYKNTNNSYYKNIQKLGDLYIYTDGRPMEFIEFSE